MNTIKKSLLLLGLGAFLFTSCVQDLDVTPKDPNKIKYFDQNGVFTKIYATLATTGQTGPAGNGDVEGIDEGVSAFVRMIFELNEFPTDEGWWIWNDVGLADIRIMNWNGDNALVKGLYYRFNIDTEIILTYKQKADVVETQDYNIGRSFERKKASVLSPTAGASDKDWRYTVPMFTGELKTGKETKKYVDQMVKEKDVIKLHIDADGNVTERK